MLQRTVFVNKIRMLHRTQMLQRTRRNTIAARACAWRVGFSRFEYSVSYHTCYCL